MSEGASSACWNIPPGGQTQDLYGMVGCEAVNFCPQLGLCEVNFSAPSAHDLVMFLKSHRTWDQEAARGRGGIFNQPLLNPNI